MICGGVAQLKHYFASCVYEFWLPRLAYPKASLDLICQWALFLHHHHVGDQPGSSRSLSPLGDDLCGGYDPPCPNSSSYPQCCQLVQSSRSNSGAPFGLPLEGDRKG